MKEKKYFNSIEGLRAISCIGIMIMHINANCNYNMNGIIGDKIIPFFTNFVYLFMIISAFGICCGYYESISTGAMTITIFYKKRYSKIVPFFSIICVLDFIMGPSKDALYELLADLTLAFGLLSNANISVVGVGWFLGTVFVFYMLFPFICFLIRNKKSAWLAFVVTIFYQIACNNYFEQSKGRVNFIYSSMFFMAGCLIYLYKDELVSIVNRFRWIVLFINILITTFFFTTQGKTLSISNIWMLVMFCGLLIYALGVNSKILYNPISKFISSISMEIYLCHMVIFRVVEKLHLNYLFGKNVVSYVITCILVFIGSILFSVLVISAIELLQKKITRSKCGDF